MTGITPPVIPAKAGIHRSADPLVAAWIPAFAGMTMRAPAICRGGKHLVA
jgi:hypothetical protein